MFPVLGNNVPGAREQYSRSSGAMFPGLGSNVPGAREQCSRSSGAMFPEIGEQCSLRSGAMFPELGGNDPGAREQCSRSSGAMFPEIGSNVPGAREQCSQSEVHYVQSVIKRPSCSKHNIILRKSNSPRFLTIRIGSRRMQRYPITNPKLRDTITLCIH